jgi:hypothetical protein
MALTKTARTVVATGAAILAGTTERGRLDLTAAYGGTLTFKMTNAPTGPTVQCTANVLIAHNATQPAAGSRGSDWKTVFSVGNGTSANAVGEWSYKVPPEVMQLEIEFTGHTGQSVAVEAYFSELTSL